MTLAEKYVLGEISPDTLTGHEVLEFEDTTKLKDAYFRDEITTEQFEEGITINVANSRRKFKYPITITQTYPLIEHLFAQAMHTRSFADTTVVLADGSSLKVRMGWGGILTMEAVT